MNQRLLLSIVISVSLLYGVAASQAVPDSTHVATPVAPANPRPAGQMFPMVSRPDTTGEVGRRIMIARQLMGTQNYAAAADLLAPLIEQDPDNQTVISLLRSCYAQLRQFASAELLVRRQLAKDDRNLGAWLDLAELQSDQGLRDSSRQSYSRARRLLNASDTIRILSFLRSEISRSMDDDAASLLDSLRRATKDSQIFSLERGQLYEHARDYAHAVREYIPLMKSDTDYVTLETQRRLTALLDYADSRADVEKGLLEMSRISTNQYLARLLADYYIKTDQFDKAFDFAIKRDSLAGLKGSSLIYFMRQCHDRKMYTEVVRLGDYVLSHYAQGPAYFDASLSYADALAHLGRTAEAVTLYDKLISGSPRPQDKGEGLVNLGMLYFDFVKDYRKALVYFDSVVNHYQFGYGYMNAKRMRPYCMLRLGDRAAAQTSFAELKSLRIMDEITEEATYELAMLKFYNQQYDSASADLRKMIVDFPRGYYVNDAIQVLMATDDAKDHPELLTEFSNALLFQDQQKYDSCRIWLDRMARVENSPLADDALYRLMRVCLILNDSTGAMETIDRLVDGFPDSYYIPFGLKQKADMLSLIPARLEEGKTIYKRILEQFPNNPMASDVRKRLRALDTDRKIG